MLNVLGLVKHGALVVAVVVVCVIKNMFQQLSFNVGVFTFQRQQLMQLYHFKGLEEEGILLIRWCWNQVFSLHNFGYC